MHTWSLISWILGKKAKLDLSYSFGGHPQRCIYSQVERTDRLLLLLGRGVPKNIAVFMTQTSLNSATGWSRGFNMESFGGTLMSRDNREEERKGTKKKKTRPQLEV